MSLAGGGGLLVAHLLPIGAGSLVVRAIAPRRGMGPVESWALGFGTGWGILSLVHATTMMMGGEGSRALGTTALVVAGVAAAFVLRFRADATRSATQGGTADDAPGQRAEGASAEERASSAVETAASTTLGRWWFRVLVAGVVVHVGLLLADTVTRPVTFGDPMLLWMGRAGELFHRPDLARHVDDLRAEATFHPEYPLLVPLSARWIYLWLGRVDDRLVMTLFAGWLAALFVVLGSAVRRISGSRIAGWLLVLLACGTDRIREYGTRAFADVPLAFALLAAAALLVRAATADRKGDTGAARRWRILSAVLAGAGAMTKNEGVAAVVGLALAAALTPRRGAPIRERASRAAPFVAAFAVAAVPWLVFGRMHGLSTGYFDVGSTAALLERVGRIAPVARAFGLEWIDPAWGFAYVVGILSYLRASTWRDPARRAFSIPWLFLVACFFGIFLLTPVELDRHLRTALDRLLLQAFPLVLLGVAAWWRDLHLAPANRVS